MAQFPSMPLFVDAYMADTMHLTEAEDGVYMRLLMCMWRMEGRLPDDDVRLSRFARVSKGKWVRSYRPVLKDFFTISDGFWSQKRLAKEWEHIAGKMEKNRHNGARGGRPKSLKNNNTGKANGFVSDNPTDNPNETQAVTQTKPKQKPPIPIPIPIPKPNNTTQQPLESVSGAGDCCVVESDPDGLLDIPPSLDKRGEGSPNPVVQVIAAFDQAIADAWGDNRRRPYPNQTDTLEARAWLDAGLDLEHIKTVFAGTMASLHGQGKEPPGLLKYFSGFIANRPTAPRIQPGHEAGVDTHDAPMDPKHNGANIIEWQARLDGFRDRQLWLDTWGPKPDDPACEAPPWLVTEFQEESGMETPQEVTSEEA